MPSISQSTMRVARVIAEGLLVVLLGMMAAKVFWLILAPATQTGVNSTQSQSGSALTAQVSTAPTDLSVLWLANPFSKADPRETALLTDIVDAPETNLNLTLVGSRAVAEDGLDGAAYIITPEGQQKTVRVDETIIDGVILERIFSDRITIRSRGRLETLSRFEDRQTGLFTPNISPVCQNEPQNTLLTAEDLLSGVSISPVQSDGDALVGYRISARGGQTTLRRAGFLEGDLLTSLNGISVSAMRQSQVIDRLLGASRVEAIVERNGAPVAVSFELSEGLSE